MALALDHVFLIAAPGAPEAAQASDDRARERSRRRSHRRRHGGRRRGVEPRRRAARVDQAMVAAGGRHLGTDGDSHRWRAHRGRGRDLVHVRDEHAPDAIGIYDAATGRELRIIHEPNVTVTALAFSGNWLYIGTETGQIIAVPL